MSERTQYCFWTYHRLQRVARAFILALVFAVVAIAVTDHDRSSMILRGDFPGFYAPGVIVARNLQSQLYDQQLQREVENEFWPSLNNSFLYSVYPPYTAVLLRPFATVGPIEAKWLGTLIALGAFSVAALLLCRVVGVPPSHRFPIAVLLLAQAPILISVLATQNSTISMLLYFLAYVALRRQTKAGEYLAGLALGVWLFKPQFAVIALLFLIIARRRRVLVGALLPGALYVLLGNMLLGANWLPTWMEALAAFGSENYLVNGTNMVSLIAVERTAAESFGLSAALRNGLDLFALFGSALLFGLVLGRFLWGNTKRGTPESLLHAYALLGPAIVLISPQTLFYDLGLALLPCGLYLKLDSDRAIWRAVFLTALIALLTSVRHVFPVPILSLVAAFSFCFIFTRSKQVEPL